MYFVFIVFKGVISFFGCFFCFHLLSWSKDVLFLLKVSVRAACSVSICLVKSLILDHYHSRFFFHLSFKKNYCSHDVLLVSFLSVPLLSCHCCACVDSISEGKTNKQNGKNEQKVISVETSGMLHCGSSY